MGGVVRFSEASSIALHAMVILAGAPQGRTTAQAIADRLPVSAHHLAKVMQRLVRAGLVQSVRGPGGGFALAADPRRTTLLDVHEAIEGKLEVSACLFDEPQCCGACLLGDTLAEANQLVHARLARTRLADLVDLFAPAARPGGLVALGRGAPRPARRRR
jgi:Rrf2 family protein